MKRFFPDNDWLTALRNQLRQTPPCTPAEADAGWEALQARMEAESHSQHKPKYRNVLLLLLLFLGFGGGLTIYMASLIPAKSVNTTNTQRELMTALDAQQASGHLGAEQKLNELVQREQDLQEFTRPKSVLAVEIGSNDEVEESPVDDFTEKRQTHYEALPETSKLNAEELTLDTEWLVFVPDNNFKTTDLDFMELVAIEDLSQSNEKRIRFRLGTGIAPFWHLNDPNKITQIKPSLGLELGLVADYKLNEKVHLNSGLLIMAQASALEKTDRRTLTARVPEEVLLSDKPTCIEGSLIILNIPVNVRRYWQNEKGNQVWFAQAGLSNYIYLKEQFLRISNRKAAREVGVSDFRTYEYTARENELSGGDVDLLSTVNLSVGSEWKLNDKVRFQVEPFLHIPLRSLTSERTKFYTTGARLRLSFQRKAD